jgi:hypothetical protein
MLTVASCCALRFRHNDASNLTTLSNKFLKRERVKMSYYFFLLVAFGLGLMLRPIFEDDRRHADLHGRFFRDRYD